MCLGYLFFPRGTIQAAQSGVVPPKCCVCDLVWLVAQRTPSWDSDSTMQTKHGKVSWPGYLKRLLDLHGLGHSPAYSCLLLPDSPAPRLHTPQSVTTLLPPASWPWTLQVAGQNSAPILGLPHPCSSSTKSECGREGTQMSFQTLVTDRPSP